MRPIADLGTPGTRYTDGPILPDAAVMIVRRGVNGLVLAALLSAMTPHAQAADPDPIRRAVRQDMTARINRDRANERLRPVVLDPEFSGFADAHCARQLAEGTVGHFTLDGLPPYTRYSHAGSNDGIAENAVAWSASYRFSSASILDLSRRSHEAMMAEAPPEDSHRRAILDPWATHVAIGIAWEGKEFRFVQIFFRRHIEWTSVPDRTARAGERIRASGRPTNGWAVAGASVHHEPLPAPLTRERVNRIESYSLPGPTHEYRPLVPRIPGAERETLSRWASRNENGALRIRRDGSFSFDAPLQHGPGIYTLVVWLSDSASSRPVAASHISTIVAAPPLGESAPGGR